MKAARALAIALILACTGASRTSFPSVDVVFARYDATNVPGCALGIFRNGAIAYARGYGMADLERNVRITPASLFDVGSVSKQFSAAAILLLASEGKLSLTDDVRKYIPELPRYGAPITLNELMWHTSGLRDYTDLLELAGYGLEQRTTDDDALSLIARQRHLEFPSGSQYEYSNTNYFLLSVIVKRVTGQTLAQFVTRNIFKPLGMNHTMYRTQYAMLVPDRAMGYGPIGNGRFANSMSNWEQTGDGGVQISINDAAKWDENFYHPRVGGRQLIDELETRGHLANGRVLHYARGLEIGTYRGLRLVSHGGAWIGYRAEFDRYPAVHASVVVLCNSDAASPGTLAKKVADIVLRPYLAPVAQTAGASATRNGVALNGLAGAYLDETGGDIYHIVEARNALALQAGGTSYPLTPAGGSAFRLGSTLVTFVLDSSGDATALKLNEGDEDVVARKFTPVTPSAAQLPGATGSYYSSELGVTWGLRAEGNAVFLVPSRFLPAGAAGKLHPLLADTFASDGGFLIRFTRNSAGAISGLSLDAGRGLRSLSFTRER
jgi:CubicO group peptidase (beta-lactamase class C family)